MTPAEELRAAAAKVRITLPPYLAKATVHLVQSDSEAIDAVAWCVMSDHEPYTDCGHCLVAEMHHEELAALVAWLLPAREQLAAWLDWAAEMQADGERVASRLRVKPDEGSHLGLDPAVAVARAVLGTDT